MCKPQVDACGRGRGTPMQVAGAEAKRRRTFTKRLSVSSCSPTASTQHQQPLTGASHLGKAPVHLLLAHCKATAPRTFAKRLSVSSCSRLACSLRCRSSSSLTRLRRKALRRTSTGRWFCGEGRAGEQHEWVQQTAAALQQHTRGMQGVQGGGVQQTAQNFQGHESGKHQVGATVRDGSAGTRGGVQEVLCAASLLPVMKVG